MNEELNINGTIWIKKPEVKKMDRLERWIFNDVCSPIKFSNACVHMIELRSNERVLSEDDVSKVLCIAIGQVTTDIILGQLFDKELGFGGSDE